MVNCTLYCNLTLNGSVSTPHVSVSVSVSRTSLLYQTMHDCVALHCILGLCRTLRWLYFARLLGSCSGGSTSSELMNRDVSRRGGRATNDIIHTFRSKRQTFGGILYPNNSGNLRRLHHSSLLLILLLHLPCPRISFTLNAKFFSLNNPSLLQSCLHQLLSVLWSLDRATGFHLTVIFTQSFIFTSFIYASVSE